MILKSFGCSFIYGSNLSDDNSKDPLALPSQLAWPALLAKNLDCPYQCYAWPGVGNLYIMEKILTQSAIDQDAVFVIGWTWIDRFDYTSSKNFGSHKDLKTDTDWWNTIVPGNKSKISKIYYQNLHSQLIAKLTTLVNIKITIDTLKQKNIPFIMTYMDDLIFETRWHVTPAILDLQKYIRPYLTTFDGKNFLEYSKEKGFPISDTLHPLEAAHQAGFELIQSNFDTILHKA
jgi:hypothetical protein